MKIRASKERKRKQAFAAVLIGDPRPEVAVTYVLRYEYHSFDLVYTEGGVQIAHPVKTAAEARRFLLRQASRARVKYKRLRVLKPTLLDRHAFNESAEVLYKELLEVLPQ